MHTGIPFDAVVPVCVCVCVCVCTVVLCSVVCWSLVEPNVGACMRLDVYVLRFGCARCTVFVLCGLCGGALVCVFMLCHDSVPVFVLFYPLPVFVRRSGVCVSSSGSVFVADQGNHAVRLISSAGDVTTIAGCGRSGHQDGDAKKVHAALSLHLTTGNTETTHLHVATPSYHLTCFS